MPPCGSHEPGGQILESHGNALPTAFLEKITNFIFSGFSTAQCRLDRNKTVGPREAYDPNLVSKEFIMIIEPAQVFRREGTSDT